LLFGLAVLLHSGRQEVVLWGNLLLLLGAPLDGSTPHGRASFLRRHLSLSSGSFRGGQDLCLELIVG